MAFNLNKLSTKDLFTLQLEDPDTEVKLVDDEGKPVTVDIYGPGSQVVRNATLALQNRQLKRGKKQMSAELLREESIELLASAIAGSANLEYNDKAPKSKADWIELLSDPNLEWIKDQIAAAQNDVSNFLPK